MGRSKARGWEAGGCRVREEWRWKSTLKRHIPSGPFQFSLSRIESEIVTGGEKRCKLPLKHCQIKGRHE